MQSTERYNQYKDTLDIDRIYLLIKRGDIKAGRFAHRIKLKKNFKIGKELFTDGSQDHTRESGQRSEVPGVIQKEKE